MTNLDSILKRRDITLPTKVHLVKAMVFPVVMYGCESWTVKKDECWRIDAFELWCWRRLLRVPWTARRSNQSILKEISPGYSLEGLMLKLKLQFFGHLMWRVDSLEKTLMLGRIGGRRRGRQRMRGLEGITNSMVMSWINSRSLWWTGRPGMLWFMVLQRVGHDWVTELGTMASLGSRVDGHGMYGEGKETFTTDLDRQTYWPGTWPLKIKLRFSSRESGTEWLLDRQLPCSMNCQTKFGELIPEKLNIIEESETYSKISTATVFWRRKWQPTPVLLPGKSHGDRSLVGYSPWGRKESDMTEWLHFPFTVF